jgi:hypothetical protein
MSVGDLSSPQYRKSYSFPGSSRFCSRFDAGDGDNCALIGRFNQDSDDYDGPGRTSDGVHWADSCPVIEAGHSGPAERAPANREVGFRPAGALVCCALQGAALRVVLI